MNTEHTIPFLIGMNVTATTIIGLFFFNFWRRTHDRFFMAFAVAFWLLAAHWGSIAVLGRTESAIVVYLLRFFAFAVIILAILDKNRKATP